MPGIGGIGFKVVVERQIAQPHHKLAANLDDPLIYHFPQIFHHAVIKTEVYKIAFAHILAVGGNYH